AVVGTSAIAATTTAIDSGRISAQPRRRKRWAQAGSPAAPSATHDACATVSARLSAEKNTRSDERGGRGHRLSHREDGPRVRGHGAGPQGARRELDHERAAAGQAVVAPARDR